MSDDVSLFQEIDDALRADKAQRFWQKYGKFVLAGAAGIVVLTAISAIWKNHLHEEALKQTRIQLQAETAAADGRYADALSQLSAQGKWSDEREGYVKLQSVDMYIKSGQRDKAIATLKEIAASKADDAIRDLASLRLQILTGSSEGSQASAAGRPFASLALQFKAAELIKQNKMKEAAAELKAAIAAAPLFSPERTRAMELLRSTGESTEP